MSIRKRTDRYFEKSFGFHYFKFWFIELFGLSSRQQIIFSGSLCVRRGGACSSRLTNVYKTLMAKEETNALDREEQAPPLRTQSEPEKEICWREDKPNSSTNLKRKKALQVRGLYFWNAKRYCFALYIPLGSFRPGFWIRLKNGVCFETLRLRLFAWRWSRSL